MKLHGNMSQGVLLASVVIALVGLVAFWATGHREGVEQVDVPGVAPLG